jgi:molybdopterin molybdotransferase
VRSVQEQLAAILAVTTPVSPFDVVLGDAAGCILAADVTVAADLPAAPVAALDGYAVLAQDTVGASPDVAVVLPVAHDVLAGTSRQLRLAPGQAIRVASGGVLPLGADTVVPVEDTDRGSVRVALRSVATPGQHVRPVGADAGVGDLALAAGTRMGARQISLVAALGRTRVRVHPLPRVVVIAVGDELVAPSAPAREGTVHDANSHALTTAIKDAGADAVRVGVVSDDRALLRECLQDQLVRADVIVLTGGLSDYPRDTVRDVLAPLGTVRFDNVAMDPGGRQGFGTVRGDVRVEDDPGGELGTPIFALPGHPVAAQVSFEVFVRPALRAMAGHTDLYRPSVAARVTSGWTSPPGLRQFVPALLVGSPEEGYEVTPIGVPGELSLSALARANALAVVSERDELVKTGQRVHCLVLEG